MNPTLIGIIGIVVMLLVFLSRMPVAYVMAMIGYMGFSIMISCKGGLNLLSRNICDVFASYGLTTIPLFILMMAKLELREDRTANPRKPTNAILNPICMRSSRSKNKNKIPMIPTARGLKISPPSLRPSGI